jgi:hypothetical protein
MVIALPFSALASRSQRAVDNAEAYRDFEVVSMGLDVFRLGASLASSEEAPWGSLRWLYERAMGHDLDRDDVERKCHRSCSWPAEQPTPINPGRFAQLTATAADDPLRRRGSPTRGDARSHCVAALEGGCLC